MRYLRRAVFSRNLHYGLPSCDIFRASSAFGGNVPRIPFGVREWCRCEVIVILFFASELTDIVKSLTSLWGREGRVLRISGPKGSSRIGTW